MRYTLNIVEPTLASQAGHCHGYVSSLLHAKNAGLFDFHLWIDRRGVGLFQQQQVAQVHGVFFSQIRKWQQYFYLRKIIRRNEPIFIPTAGRLDMVFLNSLLGSKKNQNIFLHFHQFKITEKKRRLLRSLAKRHPEWVIMAPTERLLTVFKESGFPFCECVPCPLDVQAVFEKSLMPFRHVLYAGAPRADKGFPEVVDWVTSNAQSDNPLAVALQVSPPFSGRFDAASEQALKQLDNVNHRKLMLYRESLNTEAYQDLFLGGIALLLYSYDSYRDKFSGVALSALYAGCPVVTIADTWMGDVAERFNAGVVVHDRSPKSIQAAIDQIYKHYPSYQANAKRAGEVLQREHDPANTLASIEKHLKQ